MVLSSAFLVLVGLAMEAYSLRLWRSVGGSHLPLIPPLLIGIGAWQSPGLPPWGRIAVTLLGVALHVGVVVACARDLVPKGERPS